jgi:peptidoglycan/xylan/chitin deacetylase (PgdA/CDA1 family)
MTMPPIVTRRRFLAGTVAAGMGYLFARAPGFEKHAEDDKALIAITLDMEMSRNFPQWDDTHWDYEKGNLNDETKKYTVEACKRLKAAGGVLHCFAVGRVFEQESVAWLKEIAQAGHPIGNHTYDHVNVLATRPEDIQFRFKRAPWLIDGKEPKDVIRENIRLTTTALKTRIGVDPAGFRTPGGFANGLADRPDLQQMLSDLGFSWVSSKYPAHLVGEARQGPTPAILDSIVKAQEAAQPFVYPKGLIEVPMSPISDIGAFRNGRWKLDWFLKALRLGVEWAIDSKAVFDFLGHPSCLYVTDPEFQAINLICELVKKGGKRAALVDLGTIARRAEARK